MRVGRRTAKIPGRDTTENKRKNMSHLMEENEPRSRLPRITKNAGGVRPLRGKGNVKGSAGVLITEDRSTEKRVGARLLVITSLEVEANCLARTYSG